MNLFKKKKKYTATVVYRDPLGGKHKEEITSDKPFRNKVNINGTKGRVIKVVER